MWKVADFAPKTPKIDFAAHNAHIQLYLHATARGVLGFSLRWNPPFYMRLICGALSEFRSCLTTGFWAIFRESRLSIRASSKLLLESPEELLVLEFNLLIQPPHAVDVSVALTQKKIESEGAEDRLSSQVMHESGIHREVIVILGP